MCGDIFGSYEVLRTADTSGRYYARCVTCGREATLSAAALLQRPLCRHKPDFVHWWQGDICWVLIPYKNESIIVLIDREDWELISTCQCYAKLDTATHSVTDILVKMETTAISLARYILISNGYDMPSRQCRRKNKRHLDFRKCNLQLSATKISKERENIDLTGISFSRALQAWVACICEGGKTISLGAFTNRADAIQARKQKLESIAQPEAI